MKCSFFKLLLAGVALSTIVALPVKADSIPIETEATMGELQAATKTAVYDDHGLHYVDSNGYYLTNYISDLPDGSAGAYPSILQYEVSGQQVSQAMATLMQANPNLTTEQLGQIKGNVLVALASSPESGGDLISSFSPENYDLLENTLMGNDSVDEVAAMADTFTSDEQLNAFIEDGRPLNAMNIDEEWELNLLAKKNASGEEWWEDENGGTGSIDNTDDGVISGYSGGGATGGSSGWGAGGTKWKIM